MPRISITSARHVPDAERRARLGIRHRLAPGTAASTVTEAAAALVGLHATEPASVALAAWARTADLIPADVERALWADRTLAVQLSLRQTLFAYPSASLPAVLASSGRRGSDSLRGTLARLVEKHGIAADGAAWVDRAGDAVLATLNDATSPLSTRQVRERTPAADATFDQGHGTAWAGTTQLAPRVIWLQHLAGRVARAGNDGPWWTSRPVWAPTERFHGPLEEPRARDGWRDLVAGYLRGYGPATIADLTWWLGATQAITRTALADLGAVPVSLDGIDAPGWLLPDDLAPVEAPGPWVALLPILDQAVMGWKERSFVLGPHADALFDSVGNAGTTIWVDGRIVGAWAQDDAHRVRVNVLEPVPAAASRAIDEQAERLTAWVGDHKVFPVAPSAAMRR